MGHKLLLLDLKTNYRPNFSQILFKLIKKWKGKKINIFKSKDLESKKVI